MVVSKGVEEINEGFFFFFEIGTLAIKKVKNFFWLSQNKHQSIMPVMLPCFDSTRKSDSLFCSDLKAVRLPITGPLPRMTFSLNQLYKA